jgi:hypothetical protein
VRATPRDLLIVATHVERVADDANTPQTLSVLFGHVAAAISRGCRTVLPPIPFQTLLEQTEAMLDGAQGKIFDALYAEMMDLQAPPTTTRISNPEQTPGYPLVEQVALLRASLVFQVDIINLISFAGALRRSPPWRSSWEFLSPTLCTGKRMLALSPGLL